VHKENANLWVGGGYSKRWHWRVQVDVIIFNANVAVWRSVCYKRTMRHVSTVLWHWFVAWNPIPQKSPTERALHSIAYTRADHIDQAYHFVNVFHNTKNLRKIITIIRANQANTTMLQKCLAVANDW